MDDTISRLAVIQIIEKMRARIGHNLERAVGGAIIEILDEVGENVGKLPSALGTNLAEVGTDCISRQSAIDAFNTNLNELVVGGEENAKTVENYLNRVLDKIKCLPSVQLNTYWEEQCQSYEQTINKLRESLSTQMGYCKLVKDRLERLPSAQPEPKRGKWHYSDGKPARIGLSFGVVCDQCGTESEYCTNFCGECGADMRDVTNGN